MTDDLDGVDEELGSLVPAVEPVTPGQFIEDMERLEPLVTALVGGFASNRIRMSDPATRQDLVELRARILAVVEPLRLAATTIERLFLMAAADSHAKVIGLPSGGHVRYDAPRGEYVTDAKALRADLSALALRGEGISPQEVSEALSESVVVKPNHTKLNALEKRYGGPVAEAIRRRRQYVAPPASAGRVRFPEVDR